MPLNMSDPTHPLWSLLRLLIIMTALTVILVLVAEKFDKTEIQTLIGMFMVAAGIEGYTQFNRARNRSE